MLTHSHFTFKTHQQKWGFSLPLPLPSWWGLSKLGHPPNCNVLACFSIITLLEKIQVWGRGDCHFQTHFHIEFMLKLVIPQAILKPIHMTHIIYISDYTRRYSIDPRVFSSSFSWRRNSAVTRLAPLSAIDLVESWPPSWSISKVELLYGIDTYRVSYIILFLNVHTIYQYNIYIYNIYIYT